MTQKTRPTSPLDMPLESAPHHEPQHRAHAENAIPKDLPRPGAGTVLIVAGLFIVLLAGVFVVGYVPHRNERQQAKSDAAEQAGDLPIVTVAAPEKSAPTSELSLPCDVRAYQETAIFPRTNGYLKKFYVDIQSPVVAGQLLAEIDSPELDSQLAQAKGALEQAKANVVKSQAQLDLSRRTLDRYRDLQKNGGNIVTRQELEEKENAWTQAFGDVAQSKANVVAAQATVDRFTTLQSFEKVVAPFDGVITERHYDVGALLSASDTAVGKEMFHIAQVDKLRVFVSVPQVYAGDIKIREPATLKVTNHPETNFVGIVARTSTAVDQNTRTMLFELEFPNQEGRLYAGMYGTATLQLSEEHSVLRIPTAGLRFDATGVHVALVKDGKIHFQEVQPGRDLGTELEIVSGLSPEDQVVTNPAERISEGSAVKVVHPKSAGAIPTQASAQ